MDTLKGKIGDLTADQVRNWLQVHGWQHGFDSGGSKGIVSPCGEYSVAEYWLTDRRESGLHIAVEFIAECTDRNPFALLKEMQAIGKAVEQLIAEAPKTVGQELYEAHSAPRFGETKPLDWMEVCAEMQARWEGLGRQLKELQEATTK